jgi:hypothetical protein
MATADLMVGSSGVIHFFLRLSVNPGLDGALYTRMARSALSGAHGLYYAIGEANTRKLSRYKALAERVSSPESLDKSGLQAGPGIWCAHQPFKAGSAGS